MSLDRVLISSSPAIVDGLVYVGSWDSVVYALEAKTGGLVWSYNVSIQEGNLGVSGSLE
jgi:outer membrane protein assembly factor BamB